MTYTIISNRVGKPGDKFIPDDNTNVEALIEHGFIREDDKPSSKSAKTDHTSTKE